MGQSSRNRAALQCVLIALLCLPQAVTAESSRLQQSAEELERVRTRIQALQERLAQDLGSRDELRLALDGAQRRVAEAGAQLRQVQQDLGAAQREVRKTRDQQAAARRELQAQQGELARQVRSAYLVGRQPRAKLLLNQQDPAMLSRVMTYFGYLNRARAQRIAAIQAKVRNLQEIQQRLSEQTEALQALELQQLAVVEQLEAGRAQRGAALDSLERRIRDQGRQLRQLQADERELQKLMDSLRDVLADIPMDMAPGKPFAQQRGQLPWPLRGPLLAGYGAPKDDGRLKWNGLWIAGTQGAPVRAVAHGRVAYVGWMHRYGLIVVVEHPGGWFTLYGHNDSAARSVGEWVRAGDEIARIGSTGGHDKPGVYFEIRRGADTVNPREWLAR